MIRLIWVDGRLAWPVVVYAAYFSAMLVAFDYSWRVLVIPFDTLIICAALLGLVGAIAIAGLILWRRKVLG